MIKEKKIGIKFYLNTEVSPTLIKGVNHFPLYVRVTYDRKTTRFKVLNLDGIQILMNPEKEKWSEIFDEDYSYYVQYLRDLDKIIQYEIDLLGDKFEIKGISKRIEHVYLKPLVEHIRGVRSFIDFLSEREGQSISKLEQFYDPFFLYYIGKYNEPNLLQILPEDVRENLVLEVLLWLFVGEDESKLLDLHSFNWITGTVKKEFGSFISNFSPEILGNESKNERYNIFKDYPVDCQDFKKYTNMIDKAIAEKVRWLS